MSRWQDQRKNLKISTKEISQDCNYSDVSEKDEMVGELCGGMFRGK